jgi:hypothetical protein
MSSSVIEHKVKQMARKAQTPICHPALPLTHRLVVLACHFLIEREALPPIVVGTSISALKIALAN